MISKILVIQEYYEGEYECRGERYTNGVIFNLTKLNELSKLKIETSLAAEWKIKLNEEIEPMNGESFSFEDLQEDLCCDENIITVEGQYNGEITENTFDIEDISQEDLAIIQDCVSSVNTYTATQFEENLSKYFSAEELKECNITEKISVLEHLQLFIK
jgi:hypothetical protein